MISNLTRQALELGAVCGVFSPEDMARAVRLDGASPEHRSQLWRDMSTAVIEVLDPTYGWQLKPDARLAILSQLVSVGQVRQLIEEAPEVFPGDQFAVFLRALLSGDTVAVATAEYARNQEEDVLAEMRRAGVLLDAVQFARQSPIADLEEMDRVTGQVKRHIAELRQRRDLLIVLPRRHFGYETERRILSRFLRSIEEDDDMRPVFLSGIGGVGKSALHARLFRHWQLRNDGPLTVALDFDRRQLNAGSPVELLKEFLRQCAVGVFEKGFPPRIAQEVGDGLKAMRYGLADISIDSSFDRQLAEIVSTHLPAFEENWAAPLVYQSIAIAFDSFEALDRRGGRNVEIVLRLEEALRQFFPRVRSLFAGREEPLAPAEMEHWFGAPERRLRLRGLTPKAGVQLISEEDARLAGTDGTPLLENHDHEAIALALKGHPLAILMLVQFAHSRPKEIASLLETLGNGTGKFEAEFAQVFLYERILDRISDPSVRALAHPGLVLRQLNVDLVREVMKIQTPDSDLVTQAQAERLMEGLEREYWLVEPDGRGFALRHRPDLRRLMLPGLFAAPRERDTAIERDRKIALTEGALKVCQLAASYFRNGPSDDLHGARERWLALSESVREAHGFYYASFVAPDDPHALTIEQARTIDAELGEDVETMPLKWRALVKALLSREVSSAEQETLAAELYEQVESRMFVEETKIGRSFGNRDIKQSVKDNLGIADSTGRPSAARLERNIADAFAVADFGRVLSLTRPYFAALQHDDGVADDRFNKLASKDVTLTPLWKILLVVAAHESSWSDLDVQGLADGTASFSAMVAAISMVGQSVEVRSDIAGVLTPYIGDPQTPFAYRQHLEFHNNSAGMGTLNANAGFGALALAADDLPIQIRPDPDHPFSQDFVERLTEVMAAPEISVRHLNKLYKDVDLARFKIPFEVFDDALPLNTIRMLRGLTPELYDPLVSILRQSSETTLSTLHQVIASQARNWPKSLGWEFELIDVSAPLLVETADQFGVLRNVIQVLADESEGARSVLRMYDLITEWYFPNFGNALELGLNG